ncbi:hypothetical protein LIER_04065 [Lithospermum erythrorhizon]|uniref:Reverse transcriptase domain-containing protein n=1 Tax=Lithospermum erythrorhizon TaxID=34254 RepID=A0AAV3NVC9_LITER
MPGIDTPVAVHQLYVDSMYKPVKQKKQTFSEEKNQAVRAEIDLLLKRGYHQIKMNPEDEEKTAFITEYELYCWKVMPFDLKNTGATYQRMVNSIFATQISKAFEGLKEYLSSPKLLSRPERWEVLQLYLVVSDGAMSSVLIRETEGTNNPEWVMFVDGARNEKGPGAGILIRGPDEVIMEYAL